MCAVICPTCGQIGLNDVNLYDSRIKKQNLSILPVNPTCSICGADVRVTNESNGINLIVLNGTCGSGKSSVAEELVHMGWLAIDGDCAIQSLRYKTGTKKYEWSELIGEILNEIDIVSAFSRNIALSHIILPEDIARYERFFREHTIHYRTILLKPEYQCAVARCQTRTCHTSVTPEIWIRHYYNLLQFCESFTIIDNTDMSIEDTAKAVLKLL